MGELADSGIKLEVLPVLLTTWGEWLAAHPDTTVLDVDTGLYPPELYLPESDPDSIYYEVRNQDVTSFPVWRKSGRLPEKSEVLGLTSNGEARAYPVAALERQPVLNDSLGGRDLVVITPTNTAGARAYQRDGRDFTTFHSSGDGAAKAAVVDQYGNEWQVKEDALVLAADPSQRLDRLPSPVSYWFGWYNFHPSTGVYGQD